MCGIAGIYSVDARPRDPAVVRAMIGRLRHRGPDGEGFYEDQHVSLGHARLSIIDLVGGGQPISNEDDSIFVVFNGEIFNFIELRKELEHQGHRFRTRSDTEVLVHLYEERGLDFVKELNGQFAIALWDRCTRTLVLVRDRAGILPLFYWQSGAELYFASEVKSLMAATTAWPRVNRETMKSIFSYWSPTPPDTMFEGVLSLRPGEMLVADDHGVRCHHYWRWKFAPDLEPFGGTEMEATEIVRHLLEDSTRIRLRADVPVGAYLSGGLDSSLLAALVARQRDVRLTTFSIGFKQAELDERDFQQTLVQALGVDARSVLCETDMIAQAFPRTVWHAEVPMLRTAPAPMGILSGLVRSAGFKVVLTGEGADEVFGGYDLFKEAKIRRFWARYPFSRWRPLLLKRLYPYLDLAGRQGQAYLQAFFGVGLDRADDATFGHLPRWETTRRCLDFFVPGFFSASGETGDVGISSRFPELSRKWSAEAQTQFLEARLLMPEYLLSSQGDRMLMMNSVEGRFPYLDHRVIEFANSLPPRMRVRVLQEKYILKRAAGALVPDSIRVRPKQPYRAPDGLTFVGARAPEYVRDMLGPDQLRRYGYFAPDRVARLVKKFEGGQAIGYRDNMALVGILSTQLWHHQYVERRGADPGF